MKPLDDLDTATLRSVQFLLSDIDDTMTDRGRMPSSTLNAMERLSNAGVYVIPVTGRPAGWCDYFARMWPVAGIVGENGAFWFSYDRETRKMRSAFARSESQRAVDRKRLDILQKKILEAVPGAGIASDQFCRVADLAIDFCEDVEPLPTNHVNKIVQLFEGAGAAAKISSIHVNGWFGDYDKLSMTRRFLADMFDVDVDADNGTCVFAGDSPNDEPMFKHFAHSVGVANIKQFKLEHPPAWVTTGASAAGFSELADRILEVR